MPRAQVCTYYIMIDSTKWDVDCVMFFFNLRKDGQIEIYRQITEANLLQCDKQIQVKDWQKS